MSSSTVNRKIAAQYQPVIEQSLINLAADGCTIVDKDGVNLTSLLLSKSSSINADYDEWLAASRTRARVRPETR